MSKENIDLVNGMYAAFGRKDMNDIASRIAPDFLARQSTELPWGGEYHGLDGLKQFFATLMSNVNSTLALERFLDAGDHVVAIGWTRGTVVGNGKPFDVPIAHLWEIKAGKITGFRPFIDNPTMLACL